MATPTSFHFSTYLDCLQRQIRSRGIEDMAKSHRQDDPPSRWLFLRAAEVLSHLGCTSGTLFWYDRSLRYMWTTHGKLLLALVSGAGLNLPEYHAHPLCLTNSYIQRRLNVDSGPNSCSLCAVPPTRCRGHTRKQAGYIYYWSSVPDQGRFKSGRFQCRCVMQWRWRLACELEACNSPPWTRIVVRQPPHRMRNTGNAAAWQTDHRPSELSRQCRISHRSSGARLMLTMGSLYREPPWLRAGWDETLVWSRPWLMWLE